jgi:hypothetical protein
MEWQESTETGTRRITAKRQDKLIDAAQQAIVFRVVGRDKFPVDMLRYDRCWPATDADSIAITTSSDARTVVLRGLKVPTLDRWRSFGWEVQSS